VLDRYPYDMCWKPALGREYNVFDVHYFEEMTPEQIVTDYFTELRKWYGSVG